MTEYINGEIEDTATVAISFKFSKAHPVVPGSSICGTRIQCGGRLPRALSG
jgi:hypothetical protein